jgi:uncharacterized Fe-S cluster-containing radical SAM superfamily protein
MIIEQIIDELPDSHMDAHAVVSGSATADAIGCRVGTRACVAHHRWMTRAELAELVTVTRRLLDRWPHPPA